MTGKYSKINAFGSLMCDTFKCFFLAILFLQNTTISGSLDGFATAVLFLIIVGMLSMKYYGKLQC